MNRTTKLLSLAVTAAIAFSGLAQAKVSEQEAARLGQDLTPLGAEKAGNADGSIPAWTGSILGVPEGLTYEGDGAELPDPYADEKPLFSITADNVSEYEDRLSDGQRALFAKYPDTFRIDVYPSHRDFAIDQTIVDRTKWNATRTEMINGVEGIQNWTGAAAFPIPQNGYEAIWNLRTGGVNMHTSKGVLDVVGVFSNGTRNVLTQKYDSRYIYNNPETPVGATEKELGTVFFNNFTTALAPANDKGQMHMVADPIDYTVGKRLVYTYVPGTRRVRQAPQVSFDTPSGPGGILTTDDKEGFNGALYKFDFKLLGKREMYAPFHNYKLAQFGMDYDDLLPANHVNPDYVRYELQRVWVVEATLKPDHRHIYGKRRFYIAEDTWNPVATDNYDGRGELFRTSMFASVYHYALNAYWRSISMFHDLRTGQYVAERLTTKQGKELLARAKAKNIDFYTPSNLRRMGRR